MVERFKVENIRLGGPVFDLTKLRWLNGEYIRTLSPENFYAALRSSVLSDDYLSQIAALVQTRIETLGEFGNLTHFFFADDILPTAEVVVPKKRTLEETLIFAAEQLTVLEATEWTTAALEPVLKKLGEEKGWSVKENFMLLRAIITGSTMSPPLLESMVVFGKARSLDRIIHERLRLGIVSALAVNERLTFNDLKRLLRTTDGNLSVHARKLEDAQYVACEKTFDRRIPRTEYRLTAAGRRALEKYLVHMEAIIKAARD